MSEFKMTEHTMTGHTVYWSLRLSRDPDIAFNQLFGTGEENDLGIVSDAMEGKSVKWTIENNGIGGYEFWGRTGWDEGSNSILVEGNKDGKVALEIDITKMSGNHMEFVRRIVGCERNVLSNIFEDTDDADTVHVNIRAEMKVSKRMTYYQNADKPYYREIVVLYLEWCNCDERKLEIT